MDNGTDSDIFLYHILITHKSIFFSHFFFLGGRGQHIRPQKILTCGHMGAHMLTSLKYKLTTLKINFYMFTVSKYKTYKYAHIPTKICE